MKPINLLCKQTVKQQTQSKTYKSYLATLTKHFCNSNKTILDKLFSIKKTQQTPHITISTQTQLDESYKIPPFIEIFRYLFTLPQFTKHFTQEELQTMRTILALKDNHSIYEYLHKHIELGKKIVDMYYKENLDLESKFPSTKFHQLLINGFTSYKILEEIETKLQTLSIVSLDKHQNLLYLFTHTSNNDIVKLAKKILKRMFFLNTFLKVDRVPNKLIIFLTDHEKVVDCDLEQSQHFRTININSAVTNMHDIIIYRKQELLKSIFHELIHFHDLDFKTFPKQQILTYLYKTHNIIQETPTNTYLIGECITETLANLLNILYSSNTMKMFQTYLIDEITFSTFQVYKILKICKYKSWEEFTLQPPHTHNPSKYFKQDSCVLSYYILKLYLLLNLDEYLNTILDSNLKFAQTPDNFSKLLALFEKGRKNIELAKYMNNLLRINTKSNKTLRMTCLNPLE